MAEKKDKLNKQATENTCQVMMIIGASTIYGYIFSLANVGDVICNFILSLTDSTTMIMLLTAAFMIFIGCFMESLAAMPVILPIVYPLLQSMGADMTQFGVMFCMCTILGGLTPPVGIYLFLSMSIAKAKIQEVIPYLLIVVGIILTTILIAAFVPSFTTFLPNLLMGQ